MKILVTGATGFAGGYILRFLADKLPGTEIAGTGRNRAKADMLIAEGYNMVVGDLADRSFIRDRLTEFTHVVHCAARSSVWGRYDDFYQDNVVVTRNLLENVTGLQQFVYISTANIYFNFHDSLNVREDDPLPRKHVTWYPVTKLMGEKEVLNYSDRPVHRISLRPRGIIGPGDTTAMPRILKAFEENRIKMVGNGKNVVDFTSVKNLAHAVLLAVESGPGTDGEAFNITDGETFRFWDLLIETTRRLGYDNKPGRLPYGIVYFVAWISEIIAKIRGGYEPSLTRYGAGVLKTSFTLNIDKAKRLLGYNPIISSAESIEEFLEWYRSIK
ncbi:MAG: NAD-dependent epimerase/dehydratase family protein [Bacteroidales bacterium]|nr:NAD-dependent epimerase/dehydratase family protein [Bacteroidales bacterium]